MHLTFTITGVPQVLANVQAYAQRFERACEAAAFQEAESIMAESAEKEAPVDEGILKGSKVVDLPKREGSLIVVGMGYGGAARAYAIVQHERNYQHRVGKRKYLEDPLLRRSHVLADNLAARIRRNAGIA